jgi:heme/copper-type cytochrome/quinol oxidase subunit 3
MKPTRAGWLDRARALNHREHGVPLLLLADFVLFLPLLIAYLVARAWVPVWPRPLHFPSGLMTVSMVMFAGGSSFVLRFAQKSAAQRDFAMAQRMISLAVVGWGTFLFLLAFEWLRLYFFERVTLLTNPWHVAAFGICYYGLTAFQAAHVLIGSFWLIAAAMHPDRWRVSSLVWFTDYVNGMFVILTFFLIFASMDLGGF